MFRSLIAAGALVAAALTATAASATEFVTNGSFSSYTTPNKASNQMSADGANLSGTQYVTGWTNTPTSCTLSGCDFSSGTAGYNFLVTSATAGTTSGGINSNDNGTLYLWGKTSDAANAPSNGFTGSNSIGGSGGAFLAADGAYEQSLIIQTITGLTVGQTYQLTFNYAGAQQHGYDGATTEGWTAVFANTDGSNVQSYATPTLNDASHGFTGWKAASTIFTATSSSQILGFIANGTPSGQPPFSLLDDVSLKNVTGAVPEPGTWAMMIAGFGFIGQMMRRRRGELKLV